MRVAVLNLTGGGLSGGYVTYLQKIVPRLLTHPAIDTLAVFAPETAARHLRDQGWPLRTWSADDARGGFRDLKQTLRELRVDVAFIPTASWLDVGETPVVVMLRNMEPLETPFGSNPPVEAVRNLLRRAAARHACKRATRVIAVSGHVRDFLVRRWAVPDERVHTVYHGVDPADTWSEAVRPAQLAAGVTGDFIFGAGSIRPARGLLDLVEALPHVPAGSAVSAVIAGAVDRGMHRYHRRLVARARQLGVDARLTWTGLLARPEMQWCYQRCAVFVMTSRAEACPNIALEAMSHGCACVAVDHPVMREFFGGAALYYRPGDAPGLARSLERMLTAPACLQDLRSAATARSRAFDWDITARQTVEALQSALEASHASSRQRSSG